MTQGSPRTSHHLLSHPALNTPLFTGSCSHRGTRTAPGEGALELPLGQAPCHHLPPHCGEATPFPLPRPSHRSAFQAERGTLYPIFTIIRTEHPTAATSGRKSQGKAQQQKAASHTASTVRKQREREMLVLSSFFPLFYSIWDPSS